MHGAHNTCWNAHHTLRKKCICARACAQMQQCRSFFAMEAIANSSWVLRKHRAGCRLPPALAAPPAVSTKPVARRCLLKYSVQIHASSWRGRRCGVAQASFNHPRWCRPHPICPWVALALGHWVYPPQKSIFAIFRASFQEYDCKLSASKIHTMHYVASNKIDLNYMVCRKLFSTLFHVSPPPAWPLPFRSTGISRKGQVFPTISAAMSFLIVFQKRVPGTLGNMFPYVPVPVPCSRRDPPPPYFKFLSLDLTQKKTPPTKSQKNDLRDSSLPVIPRARRFWSEDGGRRYAVCASWSLGSRVCVCVCYLDFL